MTEPLIEFRVFGTPQPQGSKTAFVRGGRAFVVEGRNKAARVGHEAWRQAVATAARDWQEAHGIPLLDGPLYIEIEFYFDRPKSKPKWKVFPDVKPDLDKLERAVLDSLTGVVIKDDSRVCESHKRKLYVLDGPPGARIRIDVLQEGPDRPVEFRDLGEADIRDRWAAEVRDID